MASLKLFQQLVEVSVHVQVQCELENGAWPSWAEQRDPVQPCRTRLMIAMFLCAPDHSSGWQEAATVQGAVWEDTAAHATLNL